MKVAPESSRFSLTHMLKVASRLFWKQLVHGLTLHGYFRRYLQGVAFQPLKVNLYLVNRVELQKQQEYLGESLESWHLLK